MSTVVSTRLTREDADKLNALAKKREVSPADLVRYFIVQQLHSSPQR